MLVSGARSNQQFTKSHHNAIIKVILFAVVLVAVGGVWQQQQTSVKGSKLIYELKDRLGKGVKRWQVIKR